MTRLARETATPSFLAGGGEMGELLRRTDWAATPLGDVSTWPQSLRTSISIMLEARFPIVVAWGPEFRFFYNDGYRPILGKTKHPGALGTPGAEIFPEIWPTLVGPEFERVRRGESFALEDWLLPLDRNGYLENCWFTVSYSPIRDESGGVGGVLAVVAETTARVQGERRLATLRDLARLASDRRSVADVCAEAAAVLARNPLDAPFSAIYLADADRKRALLAGRSGLDDASAASVPETPLDEGGAGWPIGEVVASGSVSVLSDLPRRFGALPGGGDGFDPAHTAIVLPLARSGGQAQGALVLGISSRRALDDRYREFCELAAEHVAAAIANATAYEEERRRAEALAEIDRAKTAFFSNVSHEFRTPLTLILGPLESLLSGSEGPLPEGARRELDATRRNAQRLLKLVNTLLDFSRMEAGRAQASYRRVDLAELTAGLVGMFRSAVERAGLRLELELAPAGDDVWVDPEMWEKIVLNLLSNALKFTFEGSIAVSLSRRGDEVSLVVRDTGIGIAGKDLPHLFKRFHRVQGAKSRSHEGTGIGLALVQDLLALHGGGISVESEVGKGSRFRATIRAGRGHLPPDRIASGEARAVGAAASAFVEEASRWIPDAPSEAEAAAPEPDRAAMATAGARVLVVDDNADMRDYIARILGAHWKVETAADGAAAIESARARVPDLVLTDVMMPSVDGFGVLRALRDDPRTAHVPVVLLSARAGEEARIEGLESGADDYLVKPFSARELTARVASQLAFARLRTAREEERAALYSIFMQAPGPICILRGPEHVIELANPVCCGLWGRPAAELLGKPLLDALPELRVQVFKDLLDTVRRTGVPHRGQETPADVTPGGKKRVFFNFVYTPLRSPDGAIDRILVIAFDVTAEVHAREELERSIHYNELFTGILGHDLRNPLSAIMTAGELLLRRDSDAATTRVARRITSSADRMSRMIEQLLDFTRIRIGRGLAMQRRPMELGELVGRIVGEIEDANPSWSVTVEATGDVSGHWDSDRLGQVISNLAGNAVQHGSPDDPLRVELDGRDPAAVELRFVNRGEIPAEMIPHLFDPFRSAEHRKSESKGLGLGLFISREVALAHGGDVTVTSAAGWTRFRVRLPRS